MARKKQIQEENVPAEFIKGCAIGAAKTMLPNNFRDSNGYKLGVEYKFKENGEPDYLVMLPDEHIGLNKEVFKKRGIDIYSLSKEELDKLKSEATDKEKFVLLSGIQWLAEVRGYSEIIPNSKPLESRAISDVIIKWIPNKNSEFREVITGATGTYFYNSKDKMSAYMDSLAFNRGFCLAVRKALGIKLVCAEEMDSVGAPEQFEDKAYTPPELHEKFSSLLSNAKMTFESFRDRISKNLKDGDTVEEITNWKIVQDIPKEKLYGYIQRLEKLIESKK